MAHLTTTDEVIGKLGGNKKVADKLGIHPNAVCMWRVADKMPAKTYLAMTALLEKEGHTAPLSLWGMTPPPPEQRRSA